MAAKKPMRVPSKGEILDLLDYLELTLGNMMRRREDGIPPQTRAEIMTDAYEPVLRMLIRSRRRRQGGRPSRTSSR